MINPLIEKMMSGTTELKCDAVQGNVLLPSGNALPLFVTLLVGISGFTPLLAADLREATFTQIVNTVNVTDPQNSQTRPAQVQTKFKTPEVIRTGAESRAELTAADQTVTRIGSNTIFSFKPEGRGINLQQGSVLFNSPTGRGGGTIQTAAATASVLGTTIIVSTTRNGGFKLLVIEGKAKATLPNGRTLTLKAGQMTFITPGMTRQPQAFEFRLSKQTEGSNLVSGFTAPLPADDKIKTSIRTQEVTISSGQKADTGLMFGDVIGESVEIIDANTIQAAQEERVISNTLGEKLQTALTIDQNITTSTLDSSVPLYFPSSESLVAALNFVDAKTGEMDNPPAHTYLFAGKNLTFSSSIVDLTPYAGADTFAFYAKDGLYLSSTISIVGFAGEMVFHSDGVLNIPTSFSYSYSGGHTSFEANNPSGLMLTTLNVNSSNDVSFSNFAGPMSVTGGIYSAQVVELDSAGMLTASNVNFAPTSWVGLGSGGDASVLMSTFSGVSASAYLSATGTLTTASTFFAVGSANLSGNETWLTSNTFNVGSSIFVDAVNTLTSSNNFYSAGSTLFLNTSSGSTFLSGDTYSAPTTTLSGHTNLTATTITASGQTIHANAVVGTLNVTNGTFTASNAIHFTTNATSGSANISNTTFTGNSPGAVATFYNGMSSGTLTMTNVNFAGSFSSVNMSGHTIVLDNVSFASGQLVFLTSALPNLGGIPTFGAITPGKVNIPTSISYGGNTINDASSFGLYGGNMTLNQ